MNIRVWERMLSWEKEREKVGARRKMEDRKGEGGRSRWRNDGGENERGKGRGWRRVYKLVIWGTGHVRGSRSLRRRNKSATYDPAFPFPSSPPTDFLPLPFSLSPLSPTSLSGSPASSSYSSSSSSSSSTIPFLRARPRLFIRELPSLIISPSLFRSGVAAMALTAEQIFQWFNGASRWKYRPRTHGPVSPLSSREKNDYGRIYRSTRRAAFLPF